MLGEGLVDIAIITGWVFPMRAFFDHPNLAASLRQLSRIGRVILFDKRGTGLSDPVRRLPIARANLARWLSNNPSRALLEWRDELLHDLASSELVAGRERDVDIVRELVQERLVDLDTLDDWLRHLPHDLARRGGADDASQPDGQWPLTSARSRRWRSSLEMPSHITHTSPHRQMCAHQSNSPRLHSRNG